MNHRSCGWSAEFALLVCASMALAQSGSAGIERAMGALSGTDAMAREAAIRQLVPVPHMASRRVVEKLSASPLSTRLACAELLEAWSAPVKGIDPWRPETLTPERLEALRKWADAATKPGPGSKPATPAAPDASTLQREIALMIAAADESEARITRERLARWGEIILPLVRQRLRAESSDQARVRLTALRYRLVSSDELAATWIEGIERLASGDATVRHAALDELGQRAGAAEVPLLLELFTNPDPMRETRLGDRGGLGPLIAFYRQQPRERYEDEWAKLVYRAITVLNDPALVPILEEIYKGYDKSDTWRIRTFYWTIRSMTGEQVLALRKKIRDEVGMERLR